MTLINGVKDAGPRGLMLPSGLVLLVTFLVATTFCLAEATQGGKGLFGAQFKDAVHCGGEAQRQEHGTHGSTQPEPEDSEHLGSAVNISAA